MSRIDREIDSEISKCLNRHAKEIELRTSSGRFPVKVKLWAGDGNLAPTTNPSEENGQLKKLIIPEKRGFQAQVRSFIKRINFNHLEPLDASPY